jgi:hypothetical protein
MLIRISFSYIIAFLLLTLVMLELHEMVHITVGRIICGDWGMRDFNVWALCKDCSQQHSLYWLATLAGPLFSFAMMWYGKHLLCSVSLWKRSVGFSLIFANIPFGRISEAIRGAGDEMTVTKYLLKEHISSAGIHNICSAAVLIICVPPIVKAFRSIKNKYAWLYVTGFLTLPLAFILGYVLVGMNGLLKTGFLSGTGIMGTPVLISAHSILAALILILLRKKLLMQKH